MTGPFETEDDANSHAQSLKAETQLGALLTKRDIPVKPFDKFTIEQTKDIPIVCGPFTSVDDAMAFVDRRVANKANTPVLFAHGVPVEGPAYDAFSIGIYLLGE